MGRSYGWVGKVLWVDLSDGRTHTLDTEDYGPRFIGGRGLAARLGWEFLRPGLGLSTPRTR